MAVEDHIRRIAQRLLDDLDAVARDVDGVVFAGAPQLAADATVLAETSASNRAVLERWLRAMVARPGVEVSPEPPPEALDVARSLVRRGIELESLMTAYRTGQNLAWRRWMDLAAEEVPDRTELLAVLDRASALMFGYVDRVLGGVMALVQREREALLGGALARRTETVRLLLDGAPLDPEGASARLGYELRRRHTAVVLWADPPGAVQGALERAASTLARAAGAGRPLVLPAGTSTLWAWLGTDRDPPPEALRRAMEAVDPHVHAAVGPTREGMTGFRRTHVSALAAHRLVAAAAGRAERERLTTWSEVEVVALAAQDREQAAEFCASVLGALGAPDAATGRLRETVRVFLEEGGNGPRTAQRLHLHRNTVLSRIAKAEELLGHPLSERRLALALALELVRRLGPTAG